MPPSPYFLSHLGNQHQIPASEATIALTFFSLILIGSSLLTTKQGPLSERSGECFRNGTSDTLRGIAIICLIIGHFAYKCVDGEYFFELAGRWAVIVFLYISGIGLTKKYSISNLPISFLYKRISKLMPSVWAAMTLFIILDYVLLGKTYSSVVLILNYLGIITYHSADGPAWYITYIIFLYSVYFLISKINTSRVTKIFILYFVFLGVSSAIWVYKPLSRHIDIWVKYAIVFPSAVCIGLYFHEVYDRLMKMFTKYKFIYIIAFLLIIFVFIVKVGYSWVSSLNSSYAFGQGVLMVYDLLFMCALLLFTIIVDFYRYESGFLSLLGEYSLEIFLLHLPFMEKYDFMLFHKPLILALLTYFSSIILMSVLFKKVTVYLRNLLRINYLKAFSQIGKPDHEKTSKAA